MVRSRYEARHGSSRITKRTQMVRRVCTLRIPNERSQEHQKAKRSRLAIGSFQQAIDMSGDHRDMRLREKILVAASDVNEIDATLAYRTPANGFGGIDDLKLIAKMSGAHKHNSAEERSRAVRLKGAKARRPYFRNAALHFRIESRAEKSSLERKPNVGVGFAEINRMIIRKCIAIFRKTWPAQGPGRIGVENQSELHRLAVMRSIVLPPRPRDFLHKNSQAMRMGPTG